MNQHNTVVDGGWSYLLFRLIMNQKFVIQMEITNKKEKKKVL